MLGNGLGWGRWAGIKGAGGERPPTDCHMSSSARTMASAAAPPTALTPTSKRKRAGQHPLHAPEPPAHKTPAACPVPRPRPAAAYPPSPASSSSSSSATPSPPLLPSSMPDGPVVIRMTGPLPAPALLPPLTVREPDPSRPRKLPPPPPPPHRCLTPPQDPPSAATAWSFLSHPAVQFLPRWPAGEPSTPPEQQPTPVSTPPPAPALERRPPLLLLRLLNVPPVAAALAENLYGHDLRSLRQLNRAFYTLLGPSARARQLGQRSYYETLLRKSLLCPREGCDTEPRGTPCTSRGGNVGPCVFCETVICGVRAAA